LIAAPHDGKVAPLADFIDVDYGQWSGKSVQEVRAQWPLEMETWMNDPENLVFPGGESMREVWDRVEKGIARLEREEKERLLLVAHKLINRIIMCQFLGMPIAGIWRIEQYNGAVNVISLRASGWMVLEMNNTCHLRGIESNPQQT
jgi:broad specificity phosphatase PhoE